MGILTGVLCFAVVAIPNSTQGNVSPVMLSGYDSLSIATKVKTMLLTGEDIPTEIEAERFHKSPAGIAFIKKQKAEEAREKVYHKSHPYVGDNITSGSVVVGNTWGTMGNAYIAPWRNVMIIQAPNGDCANKKVYVKP